MKKIFLSITLLSAFMLTGCQQQQSFEYKDVDGYPINGQIESYADTIYMQHGAGENNQIMVCDVKYNDHGLVAGEYYTELLHNTLTKKVLYEYNDRDLLIKKTTYGPDDQLQTSISNEYNEQGQLVTQIIQLASNAQTSALPALGQKATFTYDGARHAKSVVVVYSDSTDAPADTISVSTYAYHDDGSYVETVRLIKVGGQIATVHHDANDRILKTDMGETSGTNTFDPKTNLQTKFVDSQGSEHAFTYEFDDQNNWVKRVDVLTGAHQDTPVSVKTTIRNIEYK